MSDLFLSLPLQPLLSLIHLSRLFLLEPRLHLSHDYRRPHRCCYGEQEYDCQYHMRQVPFYSSHACASCRNATSRLLENFMCIGMPPAGGTNRLHGASITNRFSIQQLIGADGPRGVAFQSENTVLKLESATVLGLCYNGFKFLVFLIWPGMSEDCFLGATAGLSSSACSRNTAGQASCGTRVPTVIPAEAGIQAFQSCVLRGTSGPRLSPG